MTKVTLLLPKQICPLPKRMEISCFAAPTTGSHKAVRDITMGDYIIPKGSAVIFNLDSALTDKKYWGPDAGEFQPTRWLDDGGNLKTFPGFVPFGAGKYMRMYQM